MRAKFFVKLFTPSGYSIGESRVKVQSTILSHLRRRKIPEAFFIATRKPASNDQLEHHSVFVSSWYYLNVTLSSSDILCHYSVLIMLILRFTDCLFFCVIVYMLPFTLLIYIA